MLLFKFLFSFSLLATAPVPDAEGWVPVERPSQEAEAMGADERDPTIWVVFSKRLGAEKILVSFPDEPTYRYNNDKELEVSASGAGCEHRFQILNKIFQSSEELLKSRLEGLGNPPTIRTEVGENGAELLFWKDGFWIQEKIIQSKEHTYFLQTKSAILERDFHATFVRSFDLISEHEF